MVRLAIEELDDRIAHCLWTRQPFRHFKVKASITKDGGRDMPDISYDILVPEAAIFNLSGDAWNPACKRIVGEVVYDCWQTVGDATFRYVGGRGSGGLHLEEPGSGESLRAGAASCLATNKLTVNLKADVSSIDLRWRILELGEPINEGSMHFDFDQSSITWNP